jgi:DNA polymerase
MSTLQTLHQKINACQLCPLSRTRNKAVPGEGPSQPQIMLIGEAPGRNEDEQGKPFCGAAGKKLDMLLESAGLSRKDVFITSVVKCRPPDNRVPTLNEAHTCKTNYLQEQIKLLQPSIIGLMGRTAISHVLENEKIDLEKMHGQIIERNNQKYAILYHPAAMIYNQKLIETMKNDFNQLSVKK